MYLGHFMKHYSRNVSMKLLDKLKIQGEDYRGFYTKTMYLFKTQQMQFLYILVLVYFSANKIVQ